MEAPQASTGDTGGWTPVAHSRANTGRIRYESLMVVKSHWAGRPRRRQGSMNLSGSEATRASRSSLRVRTPAVRRCEENNPAHPELNPGVAELGLPA